MAGGFGAKQNPKNNKFKPGGLNNEILKFQSEYHGESKDQPKKVGFNGILKLGNSVELNKKPQEEQKPIFSYLQKEHTTIIHEQQEELKKSIEELRNEIKKLFQTVANIDNSIEKTTMQIIPEINEYQLSFLQRIKKLIVDFQYDVSKNFSESGVWLESFNRKKQKHNSFWSKVKNKKSGGEQYLFSNEHSAARSAN